MRRTIDSTDFDRPEFREEDHHALERFELKPDDVPLCFSEENDRRTVPVATTAESTNAASLGENPKRSVTLL